MNKKIHFNLPQLKFKYTDFEPYIDAKTMEVHYTKHHNTYIQNLNNALAHSHPVALEEIIYNISKYNTTIRNNAGGHFNHNFFWDILSPNGKKKPEKELLKDIEKKFDSFENFKSQFTDRALKHFGSGWIWLGISAVDNSLCIYNTPNQDNPLMDINNNRCKALLIGLDIWEHAYYLQYKNRKVDYVNAFWHIVDWQSITKKYQNI